MFRPLSISFAPNFESDDVRLALKLIFLPLKWECRKNFSRDLEDVLKKYLGVKYATAFNSGRSALFVIFKALEIKEGDEIFLQAFTCNAAVNPILKLKAKPIFVDIEENLNLDPEDFKKKLKNSLSPKAVMIQHTFGIPAKAKEIKEICQKNGLFLIEDCAHALGLEIEKYKAGTIGDVAFFSFGRDKIISSVFGGMAVTNDDKIAKKIKEIQEGLLYPSKKWIFQQLFYPISFALALPFYSFFNLGKGILYLERKIGLISPAVYESEKKGRMPACFPKKMPNALAILAQNQFKKLERFNQHRQEIARIYDQEFLGEALATSKNSGSIFMRYPILTRRADQIRQKCKKENIILDDAWHSQVVVPSGTDLQKMQYKKGSCPKAERIVKKILNLPTHINISKKEAKKIAKFVRRELK